MLRCHVSGISRVSPTMLRTLSAAASVGGLIYYKSTTVLLPQRISLMAEEMQYMAAPMSDLSGVTSSSEMRLRMEHFIMRLQHDFCTSLENEEEQAELLT